MTTGVIREDRYGLGRVPVDEISARARAARPGRTLLALLGAVLIGAGFVTAKTFTVLFRSWVWSFEAFKEGWAQANGPSKAQQIEALLGQVQALTEANARLGG